MSQNTIIDSLKSEVAQWLLNSIPECEKGHLSVDFISAALETPKNEGHGDCSLPIPKLRIKGIPPKEFGSQLVSKFTPVGNIIALQCKDTFLNFTWNKMIIAQALIPKILKEGKDYGRNETGQGKVIVIDYSNPNIAKPFHAGHLRSTIIGNFLKLAYRANGYKVIGLNYLGDWGKQYGLLALGYQKFGSKEELDRDPIFHLFNIYVKICDMAKNDPAVNEEARTYFKRMEEGDEETMGLWKKFKELSIEKYLQIYKQLNIEFEEWSGESNYQDTETVIQDLKVHNIITESNNAQVIDLKPFKLDIAIIKKSNGTSTYLTRDIQAAQDRFSRFHFHRSLYVVANQQDHHFKQLFKIFELMGFPWASQCIHISFGMVRGMSTRKGNVVFLEDVIEQAKASMHSVMKANQNKYAQIENPDKVAETLAVSAMVIQDFSAKRIKDYTFNMTRMTSFEGDTGPYLQYAHVRLCSIERKFPEFPTDVDMIDYSLLKEETALHLVSLLAKYPNIVIDAIRTEEPCVVVTYLMDLAHHLSSVIENLYVLGQETNLATARLALYKAARITLGNGLALLGLSPLDKM